MKLVKKIDRKESGAPQLAQFAYLVLASSISSWTPPENNGVVVSAFPELQPYSVIYRLYTTRTSNKYSTDAVGGRDEAGFKQKFTGTHPGRSVSVLEFSKKYLDEGFIIFIPECDGSTVILGTPCNPMVLKMSHENSSAGRKFTFSFEQDVEGEDPYLVGNFIIDQDAISIDINDDFIWVLADNNLQPILFDNNKLLEI